MIRAVTFDLWNTLFSDRDYSEHRVGYVSDVLRTLKMERTTHEIREAYTCAADLGRSLSATGDHRHFTNQERLGHVLGHLDVELPQDAWSLLIGRFENAIWENPPSLKEGAMETLEALHDRYAIGMISDTGITSGRVIKRVMDELGILGFFSSTIFSDEVGFCKPNGLVFGRALMELGMNSSEAVHVGDLLRTDVAGAKGVGMIAVWIRGDGVEMGPYKPDYEIEVLSEVIPILDEIDKG
ncbi:MAG: HAD family hydrolase [Candidatus Bathyarchaeota archaeon]|nr:MAG: HAD family hydrolase [Candidatus Bathyarchaeota archaeon]